MLLFKNTNAVSYSSDGDNDILNIIAEAQQGDKFALYLFILCLDYVFRTFIDQIKEVFAFKKGKK